MSFLASSLGQSHLKPLIDITKFKFWQGAGWGSLEYICSVLEGTELLSDLLSSQVPALQTQGSQVVTVFISQSLNNCGKIKRERERERERCFSLPSKMVCEIKLYPMDHPCLPLTWPVWGLLLYLWVPQSPVVSLDKLRLTEKGISLQVYLSYASSYLCGYLEII